MRRLLVIAGSMALAGQAPAQEERIAIYNTWDSFVASSVAYDRCGPNDAGLKSKFETNFMAISSQAAAQAREDHPFEPKADLANALEGRRKAITAKVEEEIAKNSCASEGIRELLKLYEANANLDAGSKSSWTPN